MQYTTKTGTKCGKPIYYLCVQDVELLFLSIEALELFKSRVTPEEAYEMTVSL